MTPSGPRRQHSRYTCSYSTTSPISSPPCCWARATAVSMSSTWNMTERYPRPCGSSLGRSAPTAAGEVNRESSIRPCPSCVRSMTISVCMSVRPVTFSAQEPLTSVRPSTSMPSSPKKRIISSRSSTMRPTWSMRWMLISATLGSSVCGHQVLRACAGVRVELLSPACPTPEVTHEARGVRCVLLPCSCALSVAGPRPAAGQQETGDDEPDQCPETADRDEELHRLEHHGQEAQFREYGDDQPGPGQRGRQQPQQQCGDGDACDEEPTAEDVGESAGGKAQVGKSVGEFGVCGHGRLTLRPGDDRGHGEQDRRGGTAELTDDRTGDPDTESLLTCVDGGGVDPERDRRTQLQHRGETGGETVVCEELGHGFGVLERGCDGAAGEDRHRDQAADQETEGDQAEDAGVGAAGGTGRGGGVVAHQELLWFIQKIIHPMNDSSSELTWFP